VADWSGQAEFHDADGFREFFAEWFDAYDEWTQEVQEFIPAGETQVVVTTVQRGRLRGSDAWVDLRTAFLDTVEDGLIKRIEVYEGRKEALEAVGLSE
jgi:ketosteroid isomerase-like protein